MKFKLAASALITFMSFGSFVNASPTVYFAESKDFRDIESKDQFIDAHKSQVHQFSSMESLREAAKDDPKASFLMSKLHYFGVYFDKDRSKSLFYAEQAADQGLQPADSWYRVLRLEQGEFIPMSEWREDAFQGDPIAQYVIALSYLEPSYLVSKNIAFIPDPIDDEKGVNGGGLIKIEPNTFMDYDIALFLLSRSGSAGYEPAQKLRREILEEQGAQIPLEQRRKEAREGGLQGLKLLNEAYADGEIIEPNTRKSVVLKQFISDYERNDRERN